MPVLGNDRLVRETQGYWDELKTGLVFNVSLLKVAVLSILRTAGEQGLKTFLPLYLAETLHFSPALVGFGIAVMTFSGSWVQPFIGLLSDRIGRKPVLFVSLLLSAFVAWGLTVASGILLPILFISLIGSLHLSLRSIIFAFAMDVTPPEIGASTIGFVFSANQFFSVLVPVMTGYLADIYGLSIAFFMFAILTMLAALWVPLMSVSRADTALNKAQQA